jgi:hypothetical protein
VFFACSKSDDDEATYIPDIKKSPVSVDLTKVPYPKLSDYKFFSGDMKEQKPAPQCLALPSIKPIIYRLCAQKTFRLDASWHQSHLQWRR